MVNYKGPEFLLIKKILKQNPEGMSVSEIARALGKNKNTTGRYLDILLISGQVDMRTYGMAKVYTLSQRVPLSAMLSYSKDMILVLDRDSRIVQINDTFLAFLHRARDEIAGRNLASIPSPDFDLHHFLLSPVHPPTEETEQIVSARVSGGGERIFKQKAIPTVFEDGSRGTTFALSDITAEVLREREIQIREERFRMMTENIQDALFVIEAGRIAFVNRRACEISGYSPEEIQTTAIQDLMTRDAWQAMDNLYNKSLACPGRAEKFQIWLACKNGEQRCIYGQMNSLRQDDNVITYVTLTDVTAFAEHEQALIDRIAELERMRTGEVSPGPAGTVPDTVEQK